jgi:flagellar biosynthesis protein FlhF
MTDVRTFRAASIQEALAQVREQMGREAVVLQTKERSARRFLRRRTIVEVTAGLGVAVNSSPATQRQQRPPSQQASALMDRRSLIPRTDVGIELSGQSPLRAADVDSPHVPSAPVSSSENDLLAERLQTIESLIAQFGRRSPGTPIDSIPPEMFHHYAQLIEADMDEEHARDLVLQLQQQCSKDDLGDLDLLRSRLAVLIQSQIHCAGPITVVPGQRRVVALVGPTGVGKTTTIAKLAANFRLRERVKLGLVTVDTYRVAAVEQLRTYADIMDLPMKVVTNPIEMRRAIDELSEMDLVLIDTAGRSPREELQLQELRALLNEAAVDEVHLVLSLATSPRVLAMTAEKFAPVGVTSLILTKLDEAAGMGTLLSAGRQIDRPMSYVTTGQDVPDDIEIAQADRSTRLILGDEDLFGHRH